MKIKEVKKLTPLEIFLYWIHERESIRIKKEAGEPKPWTDDEILQNYRFCNVCRKDDYVTQWLLNNWYLPNTGHKNMLVACLIGRLLNLPESLEVIGFPFLANPKAFFKKRKVLKDYRDRGNKVFNPAYIVSTNGVSMDKIDYVYERVILPFVEDYPVLDEYSLQENVRILCDYNGISTFMAGQIMGDMCYIPIEGLSMLDQHKWAAVGPGSSRGLCRLLSLPLTKNLPQRVFDKHFPWVIEQCQDHLPDFITKKLIGIDYQNCLCEFSKYTKALYNEGRPKQRYSGVTNEENKTQTVRRRS